MANLRTIDLYTVGTRYDPARTVSTQSLWAHQAAMLRFALTVDRCMMYAGMTTGKTLFALHYLEYFDGLRLVFSPHRPMVVWKEDYSQFYQGVKPYELHVLDKGSASQRLARIRALAARDAQAVVVLNYEIAAKLPLHEFAWTAAVADEAHRLGSYDGAQSRALAISCKHIPNKVAMTGTPLDDGYERVYGIDRWLDPITYPSAKKYPTSRRFELYDDFLNAYCITYTKGYTRIIKDYKNIKQLGEVLKPYVLSVPTAEVIDLPKEVMRKYRAPLSVATRAAYDMLVDDAVLAFIQGETAPVKLAADQLDTAEDFIAAPHLLTCLLRLQQLTTSGELESETGEIKLFDISARLQLLEDILLDLPPTAPVLIFTRFNRDITLISELVMRLFGETTMQLTGSLDQHEAWQAGAGRILLANLSAGSEGVRLHRAADVVFWNLGYSLKQYKQATRRAARYGQKSDTVRFYMILSEDTVDEVIIDRLKSKAGDVDEVDAVLGSDDTAPIDEGAPLRIPEPEAIVSDGNMLMKTTMRNRTRL